VEHVTFLIESTNVRLTCLLNPEDKEDSLTIERSSGAAREQSGSLTGGNMSDDRIVSRGRGDTRLKLKLLFDVALQGSSIWSQDVRDLTRPLWELTEYEEQGARELRRVRLFWGKGWEIPAVVESVAERYERFSSSGRPQRSWLTLSLLRVSDQPQPAEWPPLHPATKMPSLEQLAAARDPSWGVHEKLGNSVQGEHLWQLASLYYGDPRLWRLIALANDIADPSKILAGILLVIPPLKVLKGR
jgi:hypothetical protein